MEILFSNAVVLQDGSKFLGSFIFLSFHKKVLMNFVSFINFPCSFNIVYGQNEIIRDFLLCIMIVHFCLWTSEPKLAVTWQALAICGLLDPKNILSILF